ncbi:MAG TPA: ABC transporter C-terminal domain-containing protein, partial [Kofleriaceae bacterium]|nr:ABC transporter C-terminal domain-containing protein [Kofleriaceae bacterium]
MAQRRLAQEQAESALAASPTAAAAPAKTREEDKARKRREAQERARRTQKLGPLEKQVETLEARISELEVAQAARSTELADPAVYADDARRRRLLGEYQSGQEKLEELTSRWESAMAELEKAKAELN